MRLIATEEAFATQDYIDAYLKLANAVDTAPGRYLKMYYQGTADPESCRTWTSGSPRWTASAWTCTSSASPRPGCRPSTPSSAPDMAEHANDFLVQTIKAHPTRFAGLGAVAPQSPERAAREVKRVMTELNLSGVIINSHTQGQFLDDETFWPIFEAAVAHDAPIYLHPNFPAESMVGPYSDYGMVGALWGFGAECSLHVVRLILAGVFDALPQAAGRAGAPGRRAAVLARPARQPLRQRAQPRRPR